jgi:hypothetical protein
MVTTVVAVAAGVAENMDLVVVVESPQREGRVK